MLGTTEKLLAYYFGLGFEILLCWAIFLPTRSLNEATTRRYLRWTTIVAIVGILHPAVPLAARDIVGQVGIEQPDDNDDLNRRHARTTAIVSTLAVLSAIPPMALLFVALG